MKILVRTLIFKSFGKKVTAKVPYLRCLNIKCAGQRLTFHRCLRDGTAKVLRFRGDGEATAKVLCFENRGDMVKIMQISRGESLSIQAATLFGACHGGGAPRQGVPN